MRLPRHYVPRNDRKCFPLTLTLSLQGRGENMGVWQYTTTWGRGKKMDSHFHGNDRGRGWNNNGVCYTSLQEPQSQAKFQSKSQTFFHSCKTKK
jgi:hypothetical protein